MVSSFTQTTAKVPNKAFQGLRDLTLFTSPTSTPTTCPLAHLGSPTQSFLLFLKQAWPMPASGPLHWLSPLSGTLTQHSLPSVLFFISFAVITFSSVYIIDLCF